MFFRNVIIQLVYHRHNHSVMTHASTGASQSRDVNKLNKTFSVASSQLSARPTTFTSILRVRIKCQSQHFLCLTSSCFFRLANPDLRIPSIPQQKPDTSRVGPSLVFTHLLPSNAGRVFQSTDCACRKPTLCRMPA